MKTHLLSTVKGKGWWYYTTVNQSNETVYHLCCSDFRQFTYKNREFKTSKYKLPESVKKEFLQAIQ